MAKGRIGAASGVSFSRHSLKETTLEGGEPHINFSFFQLMVNRKVFLKGRVVSTDEANNNYLNYFLFLKHQIGLMANYALVKNHSTYSMSFHIT